MPCAEWYTSVDSRLLNGSRRPFWPSTPGLDSKGSLQTSSPRLAAPPPEDSILSHWEKTICRRQAPVSSPTAPRTERPADEGFIAHSQNINLRGLVLVLLSQYQGGEPAPPAAHA
eukprot:2458453-Pyramimonas_sp.AAC.1